jgi:hypothetical protein
MNSKVLGRKGGWLSCFPFDVSEGGSIVALNGLMGQVDVLPMTTGSAHSLGSVDVAFFPIPHDAADPVGYLPEHDGWRIAVAVDVSMASAVQPELLRLAL